MRKLLAILWVVCVCNQFVLAQNTYFNNTYDFYGEFEVAWNVVELDSGYLMVGGAGDTLTGNNTIGLLFIDKQGNQVWKKSYNHPAGEEFPGSAGSFVTTSDGGFALGGSVFYPNGDSDAMLWRFDKNGDTLWTKIYKDTANWAGAYNCAQTRDGGFVLSGYSDEFASKTMLIKTDSAGNMEWSQYYNGFVAVSVDTCYDGGYILGASNASNNNGYVIKTDSMGTLQWSKNFGGPLDENPVTVRSTSDGGYIVAGDTGIIPGLNEKQKLYALKLDSSGNTEWTKAIGETHFITSLTMVRELPDGSYIAAGQAARTLVTGGDQLRGVMVKLNANGDSIWERTYYKCLNYPQSAVDDHYFRDVQPTTDGGYIATGFITAICHGQQDFLLVKTNCLGFEAPPQSFFTDTLSNPDSFIVTFTNQSRYSDSVIVAFGDGDTSTLRNPNYTTDTATYFSHAYPDSGTYIVTFTGYACGDTGVFTDTVVISKPVGINDNSHNKIMLRCFPNPNSGQFTLELDLQEETKLSVRVYHFTGQLIHSEEIGNVNGNYSQQMDLSNYAKGIYYLQVQTDYDLVTRKIIVN